MWANGTVLANEHLRVEVDPADGTLTIDADGVHVSGANRFVDGGDGGDTYNYSPPATDTVVDRPESVTISIEESGPVRARIAADGDVPVADACDRRRAVVHAAK